MSLKRVNDILTVIVVLLGMYLVIMPFLPNLQLLISRYFDESDGYIYRSSLATEADIDEDTLVEAPEGKRLVIPAIQLDEEIIIGDSPSLVHAGAWKRPNTSTPDQGGNTVITGHRFTYDTPATFYHLDKLEVGDKLGVWWDGQEYVYEIFNVLTVEPSAIEIEGFSDIPMLTLYTCTPVWTATNRLVVQAVLVNEEVLEGVES